MTVDNPNNTVADTANIKDKVSEAKENEEIPLSIQTEPPTTVAEELPSSNEEKRSNAKRRGLFNNPFKQPPKKETSEEIMHVDDAITREVTDNEGKTPTSAQAENKIAKGLGNLYTRIKKTASSHNIKDVTETPPSSPPAANAQEADTATEASTGAEATADPKEDADDSTTKPVSSSSSSSSSSSCHEDNIDVHETETPPTAGDHSSSQKRQSLLSKLFGGNNKKKDEHAETEHTRNVVVTNGTALLKENDSTVGPTVDLEGEQTSPSSPKLTRRVTGFFTKKIPSYKKQKDKTEISTVHENTVGSTTVTEHNTNTETSTTTNGKEYVNEESHLAAAAVATEVTDETTTNTAPTVA